MRGIFLPEGEYRMVKAAALAASVGAASSQGAQSCRQLPGAAKLDTERYMIFYRTRPDRIAVGQHFAMDVSVCPRRSGQPGPEAVRVDAHMPEHRHGMN